MKQKLLLVDDRPENLLVLESTLDDPKLDFVKAGSGEEALRQLLRNEISLILLDVQMPGMDGFETAQLIRGNPLTKNIPIIFVSAISKEQKHIFKGYESGAIDYIFKPFDPDIMKSKVNILLQLDRQRRIVESQNVELMIAKKNTDSILHNVKEGIFLLDKDFKILPQYSRALDSIFQSENLSGQQLLKLLDGKISADAFNACFEYLELSFDPSIDENIVNDLNPLAEIEYEIIKSGDNEKDIKYLSFDCQRIYIEEEVDRLIFTVTDDTEKKLLERQLERAEEKSMKQMDFLLSILHVDPKLLKDFVESVDRDIEDSLSSLPKLLKPSARAEILDQMYRCMHQIKGNAAVLDLGQFMDESHKAEDYIGNLKKKGKITDEDLQPLYRSLELLRSYIEEINQLISKISHIYQYFRPKRKYEVEVLLRVVKNLVKNLEGSTKKKVELIYNNFDGVSIPYKCRLDLKDILVQLTRNAFYHGVESPAERQKVKKEKSGQIVIETFNDNGSIGFSFRDDGRGLQIEKIRKAALITGQWKKSEIDNWDDEKVKDLIFIPGVTTASNANTTAGRGIGMDVIKQMVDKLGGSIRVNTEIGKFTEFKICFPGTT